LSLAFDLQSHSTCSDGALPAAEVVARAAGAGVRLLALSDHDTVAGVAEALAAGARLGVRVLPAVEISSIDDPAVHGATGSARELHILGYLVDHESETFAETLAGFLADRERRTLRMAQALEDEGWELERTAIEARVAAGRPIGRPHLAEAVLDAPANAARLRDEGIEDVGGLIRAYLVDGKPAFRLRETPTVDEAIDAIHAAGGVAIWAHPFWDVESPEEAAAMVSRFAEAGIDGIEAFYVTHTREQTELLHERCAALDLLTTGSSDFHGPENRLFSRFLAFETYGLRPNLGALG
jgi:3',5'-nucleoside bisphosphate phosphatase